ncbi:MAG: hypothetical protein JSR37_02235 [Verrucomicrobia bacterium]|nr:hypothetical protein [Verrucomicrobiota bacterium]MBS0637787.1 hypothetical protein [Verrucomicrobiota bacterium]
MISLEKIINADWNKEFLSSTGVVATRGIGARLIKWVSQIPLVGKAIAGLFPRADIMQASKSIKEFVINLLLTGTASNNAELRKAASKVNALITHIADKRPGQKEELLTARIDIAEINTAIEEQESLDLEDLDLNTLDQDDEAVAAESQEELTPAKIDEKAQRIRDLKRRFSDRQLVLAAKKMQQAQNK